MGDRSSASPWSPREDGKYHAAQLEPGESVQQYLARANVPEHTKRELARWMIEALHNQNDFED